MSRVDFGDAFSFVGEPTGDFVSLGSDDRKHHPGRRTLPVAIICLSLVGAACAVFLNSTVIARISSSKNAAKGSGQPRRLAAASTVNPARSAPTGRRGSPLPTSAGSGRQVAYHQAKFSPAPWGKNASTPERREIDPDADGSSRFQEAKRATFEAMALLESRGIVQRSSGFVLRSEEDVKSKLLYLRSRAEEFNATAERLAVTQRISELDEWMTRGNASIAELGHQMAQYKGIWRGGILYHGMNMEENDTYEQMRANRDAIIRNRDTSWRPELERLKRLPGPGLYQAEANFKTRRVAAFDALKDLVEAVAGTKKNYDALPKALEIRKALDRFAPLHMGPSPEFDAVVRELGVFQKSVGERPTFQDQ